MEMLDYIVARSAIANWGLLFPCDQDQDQVLRWSEMVKAIRAERHASIDAGKATSGVRLGGAAPRL